MAEAWNTIDMFYVDRNTLKSQPLTYGAISGMIDSLGDSGHSAFLTPEMIREQRKLIEGQFNGVGIELRMENGHALIVAPLDGSPAKKAGLRSGEFISGVDGKNLMGLNLIQIGKLLSGTSGTRVRLTIFNPATNSSREVTLTRTTIKVENVRWKILPGTGKAHLRIAAFSEGVTKNLRKALKTIRQQRIRGIILDLRDNPGGLLEEAVGCSSQFIGDGDVLIVKDAAGKINRIPVKPGGKAIHISLVVLVNGGTSSAAEIMAGAIQDAGRAKLVGKKTFGAGTVLRQFDLSDGSALMLAVQEWLTPKGHSIWHSGITPDIEITLSEAISPLLPDKEMVLTQSELQASRDTQLLTAITLLAKEKK